MKIKDIIRENTESDLDLFGKPGAFNAGIKKAIKQIEDPYLRTVRKVRELAKDKYGTTIRVSSVPKAAARGRATVWIGDYDSTNGSPEINPEAYEVKKDLEQMGFDSKFTGSGWLSIQVPPAFSDQLAEESDDELFGDSGLSVSNIRRAVKQAVYDHLVRYGTHWARNGLDQFEEPFRLEQWLEDKEAPRDWNQGNQYASVSDSLDHYYAGLDDDTQEEIFNDVNMMIRSIYQKED
jgi:hypothetical protein